MKLKKAMSMLLAGCMLAGMIPAPVEAAKQETGIQDIYSDVDEAAWYADAVEYAYEYGLMSGDAGKFNPSGTMDRAMLVTTLYRLSGEPTVVDVTPVDIFNDVESTSWFLTPVCWAYNTGVTTGYTGIPMFGSYDGVERQQLAVFLYRYAENHGIDTSIRTDISGYKNYDTVADYAKEAMSWAVATEMISGIEYMDGGQLVKDLAPYEYATRAQLAKILMRFGTYCEEYDEYDFGGVEIKVYGSAWNRVDDDDYYGKAVSEIEKKYNIKFTCAEFASDVYESEWFDEVEASVKQGTPCVDILNLSSNDMLKFMQSGLLYDMTNYVDNLGVNPIHVEAGTWNGKCYGISYDSLSSSWVLVYDREYLDEIGMSKTPTDMFMEGKWSYDDFKEYCIALKQCLPEGVYPIGQYPYHWGVMAAGANGTRISDMDGKLGLLDESYIEALEFYVELETLGLAYPMREYEDEMGNIVRDMPYAVNDERIFLKRAENWELAGLDGKFGVVYWPWGSNVTCTGDYTTLSDNYKVSMAYWSVDAIVNDSCDKLGIPGNIMMQIIHEVRAAWGADEYMYKEPVAETGHLKTAQDKELYSWGASRIQLDSSWALSSTEVFNAWTQTTDVLARYQDARETSAEYFREAKEILEAWGITNP